MSDQELRKVLQDVMEEIDSGQYCGVCHDGDRAFSSEDDCELCHQMD